MSTSPLNDTFGKRLSAYLQTPQDFRKYRQRLSRELLRLRHDLKIVTRDTKNYSEKEQISSIDAEKYAGNSKYGQIILLLAERSLVHSLEIKSMLEEKGQAIPGYKKLLVGKLKSAVAQSRKLTKVIESEADQMKKLEFFIYAALAQGQYSINKKQWVVARHAFSLARIGLEFLSVDDSGMAKSSSFGKVLIGELLDTLVDPSLTLAHSQDDSSGKVSADLRTISRKHCHDDNVVYLQPIAQIIGSIDPSFAEELIEEDIPKTVIWRSHEASIYNDELALKLKNLSSEDWRSYADANDYDSLYSRWSALVELHELDVEKNKDDDDMEKTQNNAILLTYLKYNMLFVKVKRDLLIIEQLHAQPNSSTSKLLSANSIVQRLYTSVVSTTDEIKDLPGVYNDDELYESLDQLSRHFTITRSAVVADSYAAANKLPEALSIYIHIESKSSDAENPFKVDSFPYDVCSNDQVRQFRGLIRARKAKVHTLAQLHRESESFAPSTVAENVYTFPTSMESLQNITNITKSGAITPLLSKPVFFDVAFNYIGYSVESEKSSKMSTSASVQPVESDISEKKKGGFFGIFGRK